MGLLNLDDKIYVAGGRGLVGSAIIRELQRRGYSNIITKTSRELDLRNQAATMDYFYAERPEYVFLAAAKVGGIWANSTYPGEFIYDNLMIQNNIIQAAHAVSVKKLLFLGSSCIYPKLAPQPLKEEYLLSGELEPTNEPYAIAKIAGIKLCQAYRRQYGDNYISVMPTNLYGTNDNFDVSTGHVLPALLRRFCDAKQAGIPSVTVWGTGKPRREFLYVDDMAKACCFLMENYDDNEIINIGTGNDLTITELATMLAEVTGYKGYIIFDTSKPDGTPVKRLDVSKINRLGWKATTPLAEGLAITYRWLLDRLSN